MLKVFLFELFNDDSPGTRAMSERGTTYSLDFEITAAHAQRRARERTLADLAGPLVPGSLEIYQTSSRDPDSDTSNMQTTRASMLPYRAGSDVYMFSRLRRECKLGTHSVAKISTDHPLQGNLPVLLQWASYKGF